jgi:hypothetical protein
MFEYDFFLLADGGARGNGCQNEGYGSYPWPPTTAASRPSAWSSVAA